MKHTPGEWRIGKMGGTVVADSKTSDTPNTGHDDVEYYGGHLICESIETQANARLIAAAPDLLEACKMALKRKPFPVGAMRAKEMLEDAVEKAEGEYGQE